jgi:hypothetical protein
MMGETKPTQTNASVRACDSGSAAKRTDQTGTLPVSLLRRYYYYSGVIAPTQLRTAHDASAVLTVRAKEIVEREADHNRDINIRKGQGARFKLDG